MLNTNLIEVVNTGRAWAFLGSGCSAAAGVPTWPCLASETLAELEENHEPLPQKKRASFDKAIATGRLPAAFQILKQKYGERAVHDIISRKCGAPNEPTTIHRQLARWPLRAYVTTNYDCLLENALSESDFGGWVTVGNSAAENAKVSADAANIVWHPHGVACTENQNSRLVVATSDYDEIYPSGSPTENTLQAVARMHRLLFVGFGFADPDLLVLLERIARIRNPTRPSFAFLANCPEEMAKEYFKRYGVEVLSYNARGTDHSDLDELIYAYGSFVITRDLGFRAETIGRPGYDHEVCSLLTHNALIHGGWKPELDAQKIILKSRTLSLIARGQCTEDSLIEDVAQKASIAKQLAGDVLRELRAEKLVTGDAHSITMTAQAEKAAREGQAKAELAKDKCFAGLRARADGDAEEVASIAMRYLEETACRRGTAIAKQLVQSDTDMLRARTVALLQELHGELGRCSSRDNALAVVRLLWDLLTYPTDAEREYLGLLTQAYFARHLVGLDPGAAKVRLAILNKTVLIADSSLLIPLLARNCDGHSFATRMVSLAHHRGCQLVTTDLLLEETVEHASWAWDRFAEHGVDSHEILDIARGARDYRPNAFISGFLATQSARPGGSYQTYFNDVVDAQSDRPTVGGVMNSLKNHSIAVLEFAQWNGFQDEMWESRDRVQDEIHRRRSANGSYKHDRQVKAEAEVAIAVTRIRAGQLRATANASSQAYFLSRSRVVDDIDGLAKRTTLAPESLYEWLLAVYGVQQDDADALFSQLIWDLAASGVQILPRQPLLRFFRNMIDASTDRLEELNKEYSEEVRQRYAVDPNKAFSDMDPLDAIRAAWMVDKDVVDMLEQRAKVAEDGRSKAEQRARRAEMKLGSLQRVKERQQSRQNRAKRKKRAAESNPQKAKRRRRKGR